MTPGILLVHSLILLLALHVLLAAWQLWKDREVRHLTQLVWSAVVLLVFQRYGVPLASHLVDGFLKGHLMKDVQHVDWHAAWLDVLHFWQVIFRGEL